MCGVGNRTCGICANAGGCLASLRDDLFYPASKEVVEKRIKANQYPRDIDIMKKYLEVPDDTLLFIASLYRKED